MRRLGANDACWCGSGRKLKRCHGQHERFRRPAVRPASTGAPRSVPAGIERPPYLATGGWPKGPAGVQVADADQVERMRHAGHVAARVLMETGAAVAPGVTTDELDAVAHASYLALGAYPSTLGYKGFSKSICTSVNEVVCHGIPDDRALQEGDIVNIDVTAYVGGVHGDTSATFAVGALDEPTEALVAATAEATYAGIAAIAAHRRLRDIGTTIEAHAAARGLGVVRDYGGHGIGRVFHAAPHVSHVGDRSDRTELAVGTTLTVEPMITAGTHRHTQWPDRWTEVTDDGLPCAQFEHTVLVTDHGVDILTITEDGRTAVGWPSTAGGQVLPRLSLR